MRGAAGLNHVATGVDPKKPRNASAVHGSVSRLLAMTVWPAASSIRLWRAFVAHPGFW
jgi:hypothetical protein